MKFSIHVQHIAASWKIKTHIYLTGCITSLVVFPDEFSCKKEQGTLKCSNVFEALHFVLKFMQICKNLN